VQESPTARTRWIRRTSSSAYDPTRERRGCSEQRRTRLRNVFVANGRWRPSFRLPTVFKPFPPCICSSRTRCSFIVECSLNRKMSFYKRFSKSNAQSVIALLCSVLQAPYEIPWTRSNITRNRWDQTCWYFVHILVRHYTIRSVSCTCNNAIYVRYRN